MFRVINDVFKKIQGIDRTKNEWLQPLVLYCNVKQRNGKQTERNYKKMKPLVMSFTSKQGKV